MEYSQNRVRMIWSWHASALLALCCGLFWGVADAANDEKALQLRDNVVSIVTEFSAADERWTDQGFGFIVGERNGNAIIVTADHVVRSKQPRPDQRTERIQVTYFSDQGRTYTAQLLGTHSAKLDLAVLEVKLPSSFNWHSEALDSNERIRRGTEVWYIGRSGAWHVPTSPGKVNDEALGGVFVIDDLSVRVGTSGAPIVSSNGILGMVITDSTGSESQAVSIDVIETAIKRWNLPWLLSMSTSTPSEPDVDLDTLLGTPQSSTSPMTSSGPDISGRWTFQMGNYMFGVFVPTGAGYFDIRKIGADSYEFSQYTALSQPESTGTIYYENGMYLLNGTMAMLGPYSASLALSGGQLTGTIWMQGGAEAILTLVR